jgi:hypothetical protein
VCKLLILFDIFISDFGHRRSEGETMGDVIPFPARHPRFDPRDIEILKSLESVRPRRTITQLGEIAVPQEALWELGKLLQHYPDLRAVKLLDQYGAQATIWTGELPRAFE